MYKISKPTASNDLWVCDWRYCLWGTRGKKESTGDLSKGGEAGNVDQETWLEALRFEELWENLKSGKERVKDWLSRLLFRNELGLGEHRKVVAILISCCSEARQDKKWRDDPEKCFSAITGQKVRFVSKRRE